MTQGHTKGTWVIRIELEDKLLLNELLQCFVDGGERHMLYIIHTCHDDLYITLPLSYFHISNVS